MWRCVTQLVERFRERESTRSSGAVRSTRLAMETLEQRTVLSANFGVDYEALAYQELTAPPAPRVMSSEVAAAIFAHASSRTETPSAAGEYVPSAPAAEVSYILIVQFRSDVHAPSGAASGKAPLTSGWNGAHGSAAPTASNLEAALGGLGALSTKAPQRAQAQTTPGVDATSSNAAQSALLEALDSSRPPALSTALEHWRELAQSATSPILAPIVLTTNDDQASATSIASLLAKDATLAASFAVVDNAASHDAAFAGYALVRDDGDATDEYVRLLAEDQSHEETVNDSGYVELDESSAVGEEGLANAAAETQRDAIESALRSLAGSREGRRATQLPSDLLEQAWAAGIANLPADSEVARAADEPGGMILLQPMTGVAGDELIAAGDMHEVLRTAVEMEATIGAYQAFDVSIDEASAAVARPASADELGVKREREESTSADGIDRQAASGLGVLAVGATALAAKRQLDDRRRRPR